MPKISVIVSNYNGKKFLVPCLTSIFKEKSNLYEVVFVDDHSSDGSYEHVKRHFSGKKNLRTLRLKKHKGTGSAINAAAAMSWGKYLFFLNNDIIIKTGWVKQILALFQKYKNVGVAQGKILKMGTNNYDYAGDYLGPFGFLIERARGAEDKGQFDSVTKIFSLKGTTMILRKDVFNKVGRFDEDYIFSIEETDLTWRMWLAGYQMLFFPYITVWHAYGTKAKSINYYVINRIHYLGCRNTITTLLKNLETKNLFIVLPVHIICWIILSIFLLLTLNITRAYFIWKGIGWNLISLPSILKKRNKIQKSRTISDDELFRLVGARQNISYYIKKGLAYVTGLPFDVVKK